MDGRTPAKPRWSEVIVFLDLLIRRKGCCPEETVSSDEQSAHRRTELRRLSHLRGANAGRRRQSCGRLYFGEAAVVGGNRLSGFSPPVEVLPGGNRQLR